LNYQKLAQKSIAGEELTREECISVLHSPDTEILQLLDAAYSVRKHFFGNRIHLHMLINAKSGLCPEDCNYCSQSKISTADIPKYTLVSESELLEGAKRAKAAKAKVYCIAMSGRGPSKQELEYITRAVRNIKSQVDIGICCSVGLLTKDQALQLREAGVNQLNHNLNTSERYYAKICTTHTYQDRMNTILAAREAGLDLCSGVIFGQGETEDDIIDSALALRALAPRCLPINFLLPISGTPFQRFNYLTPLQCLRILCLFRFLCPAQALRASAGREIHLRSLQPLTLYAVNSVFVSGYLTTPGQSPEDAFNMIQDMGFEIEQD